ncbi:MAG: Rpn family recombination-promoting nuclease/putative transposase [Spirochaetaceae bacterium]|nr:Rpn family recombination-promoting nuclease/putative transposase [Spirochaetaceae bacterium]
MAGEVSQPHDHLFRSVFGEKQEAEAAALLQAYLPQAVGRELLWSSLKWQSASFIDDRLRDSESDLLYEVRRKAGGAPAWLYVLLEHQSTPDPWLRLRLLKYSIRIWERDRRRHPQEERLRPIVPLVLYQGERGWRHAREFAELFDEAVRGWPGVPRYAHLLIDQTQVGPDELRGELLGRIAQLAMMAAYRASWPVLQRLVPLLAELGQEGGFEDVHRIVVYIATTTREPERWHRFAEAVRRQVPGGGKLMNKTQEMLEIYGEVMQQEARQKGLQEGRQEGRLGTIEKFRQAGVEWSTIEAATGMDEATFDRLKHQLDADDGATHGN